MVHGVHSSPSAAGGSTGMIDHPWELEELYIHLPYLYPMNMTQLFQCHGTVWDWKITLSMAVPWSVWKRNLAL